MIKITVQIKLQSSTSTFFIHYLRTFKAITFFEFNISLQKKNAEMAKVTGNLLVNVE
jgi:hypothetical protein